MYQWSDDLSDVPMIRRFPKWSIASRTDCYNSFEYRSNTVLQAGWPFCHQIMLIRKLLQFIPVQILPLVLERRISERASRGLQSDDKMRHCEEKDYSTESTPGAGKNEWKRLKIKQQVKTGLHDITMCIQYFGDEDHSWACSLETGQVDATVSNDKYWCIEGTFFTEHINMQNWKCPLKYLPTKGRYQKKNYTTQVYTTSIISSRMR